jgi:hypothetical protein
VHFVSDIALGLRDKKLKFNKPAKMPKASKAAKK